MAPIDNRLKTFFDSETSPLSPFWRGQLFLFDQPQPDPVSSQYGNRLLLVFLFMEGIARPLFSAGARWLHLEHRNWWMLLQMTLLTLLACGLATRFAKVRLSQVGLSSWQRWSQTERWYFLQTVPLAILVFAFINTASMRALWSHPNLGEVGLFFFVPQMIWGLYQEVLYRGILQNELVRRWGRGWGIGVSNLIYTFGPLHAYHFLAAQRHPSHLWIFAAIFSIGLFFAILFKRSGNLWIVAVLHGLGDWFLVGLAKALKIFQ